jgi:hypothetical protein
LGIKLLRGICMILLAGIALGFKQPTSALADTQVNNPSVEYTFGRQITFRAELETNIGVAEASFYFLRPEDTTPNRVQINVDDQGVLVYEYDTMHFPLRAFSRVDYWFEVTFDDGKIVRSSQEKFYYEDNRFVWQSLQSGPFRVHWYEGDAAFGQELLTVAQKGLLQAQTWLRVTDPDEVNIYTYASAQELRSTNMLAGTNWIAGHADPDLRLIEISIPPGPEQLTEMERQIPHELMHILLYLTVGPTYYNLPTWLNEGLASINEIYPNPYYHTILTQAVSKHNLLALRDICQNFPVDASGAYLAYAEAASFTRYLYDRFGADGLETLLVTYAQSQEKDCQDGTTPALGVSLAQLERSWRQAALGEGSTATGEGSLWPWVTVLGIVLVVPGIALATAAVRRFGRRQPAGNARRTA